MRERDYQPRSAEAHPEPLDSGARATGEIVDFKSQREKQIAEKLQQGLEAVRTDVGFAAYLHLLSKLHAYSPHNCLLIAAQYPGATMVNSYDRWKDLGRYVKKGEKGIGIFYPKMRRYTEKNEQTGEEEKRSYLTGFGIGNVFDIAQTEGEPLPQTPTFVEELGSTEAARQINLRVSSWLIDEGVRTESLPAERFESAHAFYEPANRRIVMVDRPGQDPLSIAKTKTLIHESAHYLTDFRGIVDREDAEFVAEASAWTAMQSQGVDTGAISFPYLAVWGADQKRIERNIIEVGRITRTLEAVISSNPLMPEHMRNPQLV